MSCQFVTLPSHTRENPAPPHIRHTMPSCKYNRPARPSGFRNRPDPENSVAPKPTTEMKRAEDKLRKSLGPFERQMTPYNAAKFSFHIVYVDPSNSFKYSSNTPSVPCALELHLIHMKVWFSAKLVLQSAAKRAKCLLQIHPTWLVRSSWFLASQSSPFSPITSKI